MEFRIYNLRKLIPIIHDVFQSCKTQENTARTADNYFALERAEKIIQMNLHNVYVQFNTTKFKEFFKDHPFKALEMFTPTVDTSRNTITFGMMLNKYWYYIEVDVATKTLTYNSIRKNQEQIKLYFTDKLCTQSTYVDVLLMYSKERE